MNEEYFMYNVIDLKSKIELDNNKFQSIYPFL